jgi:hypothetical protein
MSIVAALYDRRIIFRHKVLNSSPVRALTLESYAARRRKRGFGKGAGCIDLLRKAQALKWS